MKTNYAGHDQEYQRRKAKDYAGWERSETIQTNLQALARTLAAKHMPKSGRVLELGCGAGDLSLWLAVQGYQVTGIDISPFAIEWARDKCQERGLGAAFQIGNVLALNAISDDLFDLVIDSYCFHCIIAADRALFLENARQVLRPQGILHIRSMCGDPASAACQENYDPVSRCQIYDQIATRYYGKAADILQEIQAANFEIIHYQLEVATEAGDQDMLYVDARKI